VIGRAWLKAVLGVSAGGGRLYFYQPCQDGPDEIDPPGDEKCRFTESQPKMEFTQAIAAADKNTAANRNF